MIRIARIVIFLPLLAWIYAFGKWLNAMSYVLSHSGARAGQSEQQT
jgi:hypothetical protein